MGRVYKSGELPSASAGLAAQETIYDARLAAERILREARAEAEHLRAQAMAEGRERGLAAVTELLAGARAAASRVRQDAAGELRALAVRIAEKVLGRELALSQEAVVDVTVQALGAATAARQVVVRCHPDDLAALERGRPRLMQRAGRAQAVQLRADTTVGRGGCIVETELATIDARLSTQLDAIERALRSDV